MKCAKCDKELKGGFKREDGSHRCAQCVIHESEIVSLNYAMTCALNVINMQLIPMHRPTKRDLREAKKWLAAGIKRADALKKQNKY